ncbi:MAG: hypothetical protein ABSB94_19975 [Syntrophorhabdales bacterium]|jgi:hypothetical protein
MKRPEEVKAEFTIQWVEKAEADFKAAEIYARPGIAMLMPSPFMLSRLRRNT